MLYLTCTYAVTTIFQNMKNRHEPTVVRCYKCKGTYNSISMPKKNIISVYVKNIFSVIIIQLNI